MAPAFAVPRRGLGTREHDLSLSLSLSLSLFLCTRTSGGRERNRYERKKKWGNLEMEGEGANRTTGTAAAPAKLLLRVLELLLVFLQEGHLLCSGRRTRSYSVKASARRRNGEVGRMKDRRGSVVANLGGGDRPSRPGVAAKTVARWWCHRIVWTMELQFLTVRMSALEQIKLFGVSPLTDAKLSGWLKYRQGMGRECGSGSLLGGGITTAGQTSTLVSIQIILFQLGDGDPIVWISTA